MSIYNINLNPEQVMEILGSLHELSKSIRAISHGDTEGPTGLEAIGMSIEGPGKPGNNNLVDALAENNKELVEGLTGAAEIIKAGLDNIAAALREKKP